MTADRDPADRHLDELWSKVDAFTERVAERYPGALACAPGCSDCCTVRGKFRVVFEVGHQIPQASDSDNGNAVVALHFLHRRKLA